MHLTRFLHRRIGIVAIATIWLFISTMVTQASDTLAESGFNDALPEFEIRDPGGRVWTQRDVASSDKMVVLAFLGTECPLAKLYATRLADLANERNDIRVVGVFSNSQDSLAEIAAMRNRSDLDFTLGKDPDAKLARKIGATRTPEVYLYDRDGRLRYRGRIDDQYGIGYVRDAPTQDDLSNAIEAVAAGRAVESPFVETVGCLIGKPKPIDATVDIEYHRDIAPILRQNCVECHRQGEIAPFELTDYDTASGWADMMVQTIDEGRMPPWHADPAHGKFANSRRMKTEDIDTLRRWADAGAPEGEPVNVDSNAVARTDPLRPETEGWQLIESPDRVLAITDEPIEVPSTGEIDYRYFRVPLNNDDELWFSAAQLRPGNRRVVHHILCFAVPKGSRNISDGGGLSGYLVGYVPGSRVEPYPSGYAKRIPAGSDLIFQMHYTPTGSPETDQSHIAFDFVDAGSVTHEVRTRSAAQLHLRIPAGRDDYETYAASAPLPAGAELLSLSPHMHVRGSAYRYELETAEGDREILLDIPKYDFNWQTNYVLQSPRIMNGGERLLTTARFDNSPSNLANPDPEKTVGWGDQTWDEMMIGYFDYAIDIDAASASDQPNRREMFKTIATYRRYDKIDTDNDGRVTRTEAPMLLRPTFDALDANGDGTLTRQEVIWAR